jgi:hypothetical protein
MRPASTSCDRGGQLYINAAVPSLVALGRERAKPEVQTQSARHARRPTHFE